MSKPPAPPIPTFTSPLKDRYLLTAALRRDHRIALTFKKRSSDITAEYHYVRSPKLPPTDTSMVSCVMAKSIADDPLRLGGLAKMFDDMMILVTKPEVTADHVSFFALVDIRLYPKEWYPCFLTPKERTIMEERIAAEMPKLVEEANLLEKEAVTRAAEPNIFDPPPPTTSVPQRHVASKGRAPLKESQEEIEKKKVEELLARFSRTGKQKP